MKRFGYFGLFVVVLLSIWVEQRYGPIGVTRLWGAMFFCGSLYLCFLPEVPVSVGQVEVVRLKGWAKAFVIVPFATLGALAVTYAEPITCISTKYKHLCS